MLMALKSAFIHLALGLFIYLGSVKMVMLRTALSNCMHDHVSLSPSIRMQYMS